MASFEADAELAQQLADTEGKDTEGKDAEGKDAEEKEAEEKELEAEDLELELEEKVALNVRTELSTRTAVFILGSCLGMFRLVKQKGKQN